jgi:alpha-ketoglutaric semialdehyde dehydrogenase
VTPTVFEGVADDAYLSCEEVFGPVTSLYSYGTLDEAIERANAVPFGLSASIYTRDLHAVQRFSEELQAGILHVNSQTAGADVHVPFGGIKSSGFGPHEQGRAAIEFFTETVTVYQDAPLT